MYLLLLILINIIISIIMEKKQLKYNFRRVFICPLFLGIILSIIITCILCFSNTYEILTSTESYNLIEYAETNLNIPIVNTAHNMVLTNIQKTVNGLLQVKNYYKYYSKNLVLNSDSEATLLKNLINIIDVESFNINHFPSQYIGK